MTQAGDKGTARWRGVGTIDKEIAFASDKVVVMCEELIPEAEMRKDPEANRIPFFTVDAIRRSALGCFPEFRSLLL